MNKILRKGYVAYRVALTIVLNRLLGYRKPLMANLFITNKCNLRCTYCYFDFNKNASELPLEEVCRRVDELKSMGTVLIVLLGGEPTLRKDLDVIIDHIISNNMMVEIITNGVFVNQHIHHLKKVDSLCISVDGDESSHDKLRGNGSFKVAIDAIKLAKKNKIKTRMHGCITKQNLNSLDFLVELSLKYDVPLNCAVAVDHSETPGSVSYANKDAADVLGFTNDEVRDYYKQIKNYKNKGYPIINSMSTLNYMINWPLSFSYISYDEVDLVSGKKALPCKRKDFTVYIDTNGNLYPCATLWGKKCESNIFAKGGGKQAYEDVLKLPCKSCITETEAHIFFSGQLNSLLDILSYLMPLFWLKKHFISKSRPTR